MADRPLPWSLLVVLLGAIFVTLFPIFWIVMTAIKPPTDWNAVPAIWIPSEPTLVNFRTLFNPEAIREYGVGGVSQAATMSVLGSILSSTTATLLSVTIGLLSAIGISRYSSGGRATL